MIDNKLGATVAKRNERFAKLLHGVANMNLGDAKDHDIDAFGDAYEYLIAICSCTMLVLTSSTLPARTH